MPCTSVQIICLVVRMRTASERPSPWHSAPHRTTATGTFQHIAQVELRLDRRGLRHDTSDTRRLPLPSVRRSVYPISLSFDKIILSGDPPLDAARTPAPGA